MGNIAWSPESKRIASASDNVQIWDATSGKLILIHRHEPSQEYGVTMAWSPNGRWITSMYFDGQLQVWDANTGDTLYMYCGHTAGISSLAWSPDGKYLVSAGGQLDGSLGKNDHTVQIWEAVSGKTLLIYSEHTGAVATAVWSPDGKYIASGEAYHPGASVKIWDATTGQTLLTYSGHTHGGYSDGVVSLAWSPDGKLIASGGADGTIQVWKAV